MINISNPSAGTAAALLHEAQRLEALAADLRRLAAGDVPAPELLELAPILHDWRLDRRSVPCLYGQGVGHPRLGDRPVLTTDLHVLDTERGYARTLGRWYRLGDRHEPEYRRLGDGTISDLEVESMRTAVEDI